MYYHDSSPSLASGLLPMQALAAAWNTREHPTSDCSLLHLLENMLKHF